MRRRTLGTALAASVVAPLVTADLIHHGFTAALTHRPAEDEWLAVVDAYGRDYMSVGADALQRQLAADLIRLQQQLESPVMWAAAARLLTVYGKTTKGAKGASRWYLTAAELADRSGDTATRVWVPGRSALALAYEGAGLRTATDLAQRSLAASDRPSLGSLNAWMALAHVCAIRGRHDESRRALDAARRAFDAAGSHEQVSDFAVPEWRMRTFESMLLSRMGDPQAAAVQDEADRTRPGTLPRFATHIELHRGLAAVRGGDRAGGLAYARTALDRLPPERHSLSLRLMMREIETAAQAA